MHEDVIRPCPKQAGASNDDNSEVLQTPMGDDFDAACRFLKRQWREHPVAVAAAAVGIGIALGALIGGRRG